MSSIAVSQGIHGAIHRGVLKQNIQEDVLCRLTVICVHARETFLDRHDARECEYPVLGIGILEMLCSFKEGTYGIPVFNSIVASTEAVQLQYSFLKPISGPFDKLKPFRFGEEVKYYFPEGLPKDAIVSVCQNCSFIGKQDFLPYPKPLEPFAVNKMVNRDEFSCPYGTVSLSSAESAATSAGGFMVAQSHSISSFVPKAAITCSA